MDIRKLIVLSASLEVPYLNYSVLKGFVFLKIVI